MEGTCETCKWGVPTEVKCERPHEKTYYKCHRRSPEVVGKNEGEYEYWPTVCPDDFCGDHTAK